MEVRKTAARDRDDLWLEVNMTCDLAALTLETGAGHDRDLTTHVRPAKASAKKATRSSHTRVVDAIEGEKNQIPELDWHQRPKNAGGNVPKEWDTADIPGNDL